MFEKSSEFKNIPIFVMSNERNHLKHTIMNAHKTTKLNDVTGTKTATYKMELSFIEMHILTNAMSEYMRLGYMPFGTDFKNNYNEAHATAAEKFHDELLNVYCD